MPDRSRKRPKDPNELAKLIVDMATGSQKADSASEWKDGKNPAAVALGRLGGLKGGKARASKLSQQDRSRIASKAARARWGERENGD